GFNRVLINRGDGRLRDRTLELGLDRRTFNSQAVSAADLDGDGDLDLVFANEGREPCVLFAAPNALGSRFPVEIVFPAARQAVGASVAIYEMPTSSPSAGTNPLQRFEIGAVQGRGCQPAGRARLGLGNGAYRLEVRYSSGQLHREEFEVIGAQLFLEVKP
ncbi:MAG: FG-GAP-like repeat-containing protein, partial [Planctomycetota bacterium]|nr:FG-GAP-like repeat-containing protein [Planctomycetota bacterium]